MSTSLLIRCDHCGAGLRVTGGRARPGSTAPCPKCQRPIQIPGAPAPAAGVEEFQCQVCGALLRMRSDRRPPAGTTARCPRCRSAVEIPPLPGASPHDAFQPPPAAEPAIPHAQAPVRAVPAADSDMLPAGISPAPFDAAPPTPDSAEEPESGPESAAAAVEVPQADVAPSGGDAEPVIEIQGEDEQREAPLPAPPAPASGTPGRGAVPTHYPPRPGPPGAFWTVEIGGETLRPGGVAALRLWARQGRLHAEDRVRRGEGPWQPAREVPELASLFARAREKERRIPAQRASADARRGWLAGLLGGAGALLPVLALLIFTGEFERLSDAWGATLASSLGGVCAGILLSGGLIGRTLAGLQSHYDRRGEVANVWSFSGALGVGAAFGLACGLAALGFWPHTSASSLVAGFAFYGIGVAVLALVSHRWLFLERRA